jgi:hypothetical protein
MRKEIIALIIVGVLFGTTACTGKGNAYTNMSFKDVCTATGGMWMKMQPTKDFIPTGAPACEGCMQRNGDHICDKDTYLQSLR